MAVPSLADVSDLVRARRTSLLADRDRPVPEDLIRDLCELATWAPNHKRTWPWRFALISGEARAALGDGFVDDIAEAGWGQPDKMARTRLKFLRTPAVLVVGAANHERPATARENTYAVAAGIQNLLLGATAAGLATHWETPPVPDSKRVLSLCRFEPDALLLAVVYLGWPTGNVAAPERPPADLNVIAG